MKRIILSSLILICLILTACGGEFQESLNNTFGNNNESNKIVYFIGYNFESNNPLLVKNNENRQLFSLIYDSLYTLDTNYKHIPCLGEYAVSYNNGLNWRINLRDNVQFHDGTSFSATDVVATIYYLLNNSTYFSYNVRNILSVKAEDSLTVVFTLKEPAQNFLAQLTFPIVNSKDFLSEFNFNGTGKFKMSNYVKRKKLVLVKNDYYFNHNQMQVKNIEIQLVPDKETAIYSYSSGLADVFSQDILSSNSKGLTKSGTSSLEYESDHYTFLLLNHKHPALSDVTVRKAINLAIDRNKIVTDVLFSHANKAITPISSQSYLSNKNLAVEQNMDQAKIILLENGYVPNVNTGVMEKEIDGKLTSLSFKILVNNDNNFRIQVANSIKESLKYIGVDIAVNVVSWEEYQNAYQLKNYESMIATVTMALDFDLTQFMKNGNLSNYVSEMSNLILNNIALSDYDKGKTDYYNRLQELFLEELPHISLYYTKNSLQYINKIKDGLNPSAYNIFYNIENWLF